MSEFQQPIAHTPSGTPRWVGLTVVVLAGISLLGLGLSWNALNHASNAEQVNQVALKQANDALSQRLAKTEELNQQLESDLKVVTDKLNVTHEDLVKARKQSKSAVGEVDKRVTGLETSVRGELATKASADDVNKLNGDVTSVKNDLDAAKGSI
jgi:small-conductance mechanosensitive channel